MLVKPDVAGKTVPIAIEGQTDQFALAIEYGAPGIPAGNIIIGQETQMQVFCRFIGITSEIITRHQLVEYGLCLIVCDSLVSPFHLVHDTLVGRIIA